MSTVENQHADEVRKGDRFQFGKNWSNFLKTLNPKKIELAMQSLREFLKVDTLEGKSFIDIGSGSGLFSLAAYRLGADVMSFDYDSNSYACTKELRRRYFDGRGQWVVEQASVLDTTYMSALPTFDVVYSWGVLHHTGSMWQAIDNVKRLSPIGGKLFIAIYNDNGVDTDRWAEIKRRYNAIPSALRLPYALKVIAQFEYPRAISYLKDGKLREYIDIWRKYDEIALRGMNQWHDWIDWIGGHPYERATVAEIVDFCAKDGFKLVHLNDSSGGYGCHQFVFEREAPAGVQIDDLVPGGDSLVRRHGRRVLAPFELRADGWWGRLGEVPRISPGARLIGFRDGHRMEDLVIDGDRVKVGESGQPLQAIAKAPVFVMAAETITLDRPFASAGRWAWNALLPGLAASADNSQEPRRSTVGLFEDGVELCKPHTRHLEIVKDGMGRYSHWGDFITFSASDNSDPNTNGRNYVAIAAAQPLPLERSLALQFGVRLEGDAVAGTEGWTLPLPASGEAEEAMYLICDDRLVGPVRLGGMGRVVVADPSASRNDVARSRFHVVSGRMEPLGTGFVPAGDASWSIAWPEHAGLADTNEEPRRSPVFLFQDSVQLPYPHSAHADIAALGNGRFSHWGEYLYVSTLNGEDPNGPDARIVAVIPRHGPVERPSPVPAS